MWVGPESILSINVVFHNLRRISAASVVFFGRLDGSLCKPMYTAFLKSEPAEAQINLPAIPIVSRANSSEISVCNAFMVSRDLKPGSEIQVCAS